jgi:hypothetical protein
LTDALCVPAVHAAHQTRALATLFLTVSVFAAVIHAATEDVAGEDRSPDGDTLAERFSAADATSAEFQLASMIVRLAFAKRYAELANGNAGPEHADPAAPGSPGALQTAPVTEVAPAVASADKLRARVLIRNLPEVVSLSAGTRLSNTDWALTDQDLDALTMTLPASLTRPVTADIAVLDSNGTPARTLHWQFRQQPANPKVSGDAAEPQAPKHPAKKSSKVRRYTVSSLKAVAAAKITPAAGPDETLALASPKPPATPLFGLFAPPPLKPEPGTEGVNTETLINLGLIPRK